MMQSQFSLRDRALLWLLAAFYCGLICYTCFAAAFGLTFKWSMILEVSVIALYMFAEKRLVLKEFPWVILLSGFHPFFGIVGALHPFVLQKLWNYCSWEAHRLQVASIAAFLLLVTHVIACGWLVLQPSPMTDPIDRYIWGVYWTVTTLATVGYGDITPSSSEARLYAMAIMMLGVSSFAIFISHFSRLLITRDSKMEAQRQKIKFLKEMLQRYQVPSDLRSEVLAFYHHLLGHRSAEDEERILLELPQGMKESVQHHIRMNSIAQLDFFSGLSRECLSFIADNFQERFYQAGDIVFGQGEIGKEMYFIHYGEVDVRRDGQRVSTLKDGQIFGERALIERSPRSAEIRARKYCHILVLDDEASRKVAALHPEYQQRLQLIYKQRKAA